MAAAAAGTVTWEAVEVMEWVAAEEEEVMVAAEWVEVATEVAGEVVGVVMAEAVEVAVVGMVAWEWIPTVTGCRTQWI